VASIFITLSASIFLILHTKLLVPPQDIAVVVPSSQRHRLVTSVHSQRRRPCLRVVAAPSLDLIAGESVAHLAIQCTHVVEFRNLEEQRDLEIGIANFVLTSHPPPSTSSDAISGSIKSNKVRGSHGVGMIF
ncbi:hypothetical protein PIB30_104024, partial [Stylosanthes scabra]|nr:hypothetical protein [Stylosanthes scabra]